jgi:hypothetical protein
LATASGPAANAVIKTSYGYDKLNILMSARQSKNIFMTIMTQGTSDRKSEKRQESIWRHVEARAKAIAGIMKNKKLILAYEYAWGEEAHRKLNFSVISRRLIRISHISVRHRPMRWEKSGYCA